VERVIGNITTYIGDEIPGLKGDRVRIRAVLRGALRADVNVDADDHYVSDDATLARLGGVTAEDRLDVQPWIEAAGRFSFVSVDPRAVDLDAFRDLAGKK
jgi:hypothetical protein